MSEDVSLPPFIYEGIDPVPEPKSTLKEAADAVAGAAHCFEDAVSAGRKPGMPLSIISNIVREAPLGSILVAFMLGVVIARRRNKRRDRSSSGSR